MVTQTNVDKIYHHTHTSQSAISNSWTYSARSTCDHFPCTNHFDWFSKKWSKCDFQCNHLETFIYEEHIAAQLTKTLYFLLPDIPHSYSYQTVYLEYNGNCCCCVGVFTILIKHYCTQEIHFSLIFPYM